MKMLVNLFTTTLAIIASRLYFQSLSKMLSIGLILTIRLTYVLGHPNILNCATVGEGMFFPFSDFCPFRMFEDAVLDQLLDNLRSNPDESSEVASDGGGFQAGKKKKSALSGQVTLIVCPLCSKGKEPSKYSKHLVNCRHRNKTKDAVLEMESSLTDVFVDVESDEPRSRSFKIKGSEFSHTYTFNNFSEKEVKVMKLIFKATL